ncbi:MAG TPA: hypothetical protein VNI58_04620 [Mariprofundaceae bacterium]|nr:hypothetical protein [Mariprofundaceae bacterium]
MIAAWILLLSLGGLALNLAFSQSMAQPDWTLSLLLAALLAHRGSWVWVLPATGFHDAVFYWTIWGNLPWLVVIPLLLPHLDERLGPGLPQRLTLLILTSLPMLFLGWSTLAWLLTLGLCVPVWFNLANVYARSA